MLWLFHGGFCVAGTGSHEGCSLGVGELVQVASRQLEAALLVAIQKLLQTSTEVNLLVGACVVFQTLAILTLPGLTKLEVAALLQICLIAVGLNTCCDLNCVSRKDVNTQLRYKVHIKCPRTWQERLQSLPGEVWVLNEVCVVDDQDGPASRHEVPVELHLFLNLGQFTLRVRLGVSLHVLRDKVGHGPEANVLVHDEVCWLNATHTQPPHGTWRRRLEQRPILVNCKGHPLGLLV
mmetsp:Transcript_66100/g.144111  ORF Transcript_66100/g.144111 Transcript_66100/m.144111 type:complete len:236 (-) Transcript_66100:496-1203(-)